MERATQHVVPVRFQVVMIEYLSDRKAGFDFLDLHFALQGFDNDLLISDGDLHLLADLKTRALEPHS